MIGQVQKPMEEIFGMLEGKEKLVLYGCGGCATVFHTGGEAEVKEVAENLSRHGKNVLAAIAPPFGEFTCYAPWSKERLIKNREAQKERTYKAFYLTGDEETFKRDIAMVEQDIKRLEAEASNLEHQIELSNKYQLDISRLKEACALVASNIKTLSFDEKRLTLQALHISVMIDGDKLTLSGAVPMRGLSSVSSQARLTI